jgi:hypothetical protein
MPASVPGPVPAAASVTESTPAPVGPRRRRSAATKAVGPTGRAAISTTDAKEGPLSVGPVATWPLMPSATTAKVDPPLCAVVSVPLRDPAPRMTVDAGASGASMVSPTPTTTVEQTSAAADTTPSPTIGAPLHRNPNALQCSDGDDEDVEVDVVGEDVEEDVDVVGDAMDSGDDPLMTTPSAAVGPGPGAYRPESACQSLREWTPGALYQTCMRYSDGAPGPTRTSASTGPPLQVAMRLTVTAGSTTTPKRKSAGMDLHTLQAMLAVQTQHAGIAVRSRTG